MHRLFILIGVVSILMVFLSCEKYVGPNEKYKPEDIITMDNGETIVDNSNTEVTIINPSPNETPAQTEERMKNVVWITPGKVTVDNLYAGAKAEYPIRIHNPNKVSTTFSLYGREAASTTEGYSKLPVELLKWVTITPSSLIVPAQSTGQALITVQIGKDKLTTKKQEFWIGVMDDSQKGVVRSEICSRWMLSFR